MLDILFINPSSDYKKSQEYLDSLKVEKDIPRQIAPHIGISYLLSVVNDEGKNAEYIDMIIDEYSVNKLINYIETNKPSIIGFTAFTIQITDIKYISKEIKKKFPSIIICLGGSHGTAMPVESLNEIKYIDFVVCGEGETALRKILNGDSLINIANVVTRDKQKFVFDRTTDLNNLPFPMWSKFNLKRYKGADPHQTKRELPMSTSRGCGGYCVFCARPFGRKRNSRSVKNVIQEIERNVKEYSCESIVFFDEDFTVDREWNIELFNTMIERGLNKKIKWSCESRIDVESIDIFDLIDRKSVV